MGCSHRFEPVANCAPSLRARTSCLWLLRLQLLEVSPDGRPLLKATHLVASVTAFRAPLAPDFLKLCQTPSFIAAVARDCREFGRRNLDEFEPVTAHELMKKLASRIPRQPDWIHALAAPAQHQLPTQVQAMLDLVDIRVLEAAAHHITDLINHLLVRKPGAGSGAGDASAAAAPGSSAEAPTTGSGAGSKQSREARDDDDVAGATVPDAPAAEGGLRQPPNVMEARKRQRRAVADVAGVAGDEEGGAAIGSAQPVSANGVELPARRNDATALDVYDRKANSVLDRASQVERAVERVRRNSSAGLQQQQQQGTGFRDIVIVDGRAVIADEDDDGDVDPTAGWGLVGKLDADPAAAGAALGIDVASLKQVGLAATYEHGPGSACRRCGRRGHTAGECTHVTDINSMVIEGHASASLAASSATAAVANVPGTAAGAGAAAQQPGFVLQRASQLRSDVTVSGASMHAAAGANAAPASDASPALQLAGTASSSGAAASAAFPAARIPGDDDGDGPALPSSSAAPRVHRGGGSGNDAYEEWDEQDEREDEAAEANDNDDDDSDVDDAESGDGEDGDDDIMASIEDGKDIHDGDEEAEEDGVDAAERADGLAPLPGAAMMLNRKGNAAAAAAGSSSSAASRGLRTPDSYRTFRARRGPPPSAGMVNAHGHRVRAGSIASSDSALGAGDGAAAVSVPSVVTLKDVPLAIVGNILSFLSFPDIIRSSSVCKDWQHEISSSSSIQLVDFGQCFAGTVQPDPLLLDRISKSIKARDYSFANCMWLTSGALLHLIGVPFAISPLQPLPPISAQGMDVDSNNRQLRSKAMAGELTAKARASLMKSRGKNAQRNKFTWLEGSIDDQDGAGTTTPSSSTSAAAAAAPTLSGPHFAASGSHSYLRFFLGEYNDLELSRATAAAGAGAAGSARSSSGASSIKHAASSSTLAGRLISPRKAVVDSVSVISEATSSGSAADTGAGAGSGVEVNSAGRSTIADDGGVDVVMSTLNDSSGKSSDSVTGSGKRENITVSPLLDVTALPTLRHSWWSQLVLGCRMALQSTQGQQATSAPPWLSLYELCLSFVCSEVVRTRAVQQQARLMVQPGAAADPFAEDRMPLRAFGVLIARAYCEMSLALRSMLHRYKCELEASAARDGSPTSPAVASVAPIEASRGSGAVTPPSLLVSGVNPLNSPVVLASSTVFTPIADLRAIVQLRTLANEAAAVASGRASTYGGQRVPTSLIGKGATMLRSGLPKLSSQPGDYAIHASDEVTADALKEGATLHAMSVAYATAAGDAFDFPFQLAMCRAQEATERAASAAAGAAGASGDSTVASSLPTPESIVTTADSHFCSFDIPLVVDGAEPPRSSRHHAGPSSTPVSVPAAASGQPGFNLLAPQSHAIPQPLPCYVSAVTGLDLHGCIKLVPHNLALILRYCPKLASLRLGGCNQFSSSALCSVFPLVPRLRALDLEYCSTVDDNVLAVLGRHCTHLTRLQVAGCPLITDAGLSEQGLLNQCHNIRRLNLRGCVQVTSAGILSLAHGAPHMREICFSGLTSISPEAIATLVVSCRRLIRFKAELWFEHPDAAAAAAADAMEHEDDGTGSQDPSKKSYRLLGSVRGAIRFISGVLPPQHELQGALARRYREPIGGGGHASQSHRDGAVPVGFPVSLEDTRMMDGADMMTPPFARGGSGRGGGRDMDDSSSGGSMEDIADVADLHRHHPHRGVRGASASAAANSGAGAGRTRIGAGGVLQMRNGAASAPAAAGVADPGSMTGLGDQDQGGQI